jgi:hypothetical protein
MALSKKILSLFILLLLGFCLYLYLAIFSASTEFEERKSLFIQQYSNQNNRPQPGLPKSWLNGFWLEQTFIQNPALTELYLRFDLLDAASLSPKQIAEYKKAYQQLLATRPTWPYYYSGLVQLSMLNQSLREEVLNNTMSYGKHENKVITSLAETLFYHWNQLNKMQRKSLLDYLSNQSDSTIARVVEISAKFARVFEYCDFLYDKKRVEYAACKRQYWQPLKISE